MQCAKTWRFYEFCKQHVANDERNDVFKRRNDENCKVHIANQNKGAFCKNIIICNMNIAKIHHFASPFYFAMSACQLMPFLCDLKKDEEKEKERKRNKKRKNQRKE